MTREEAKEKLIKNVRNEIPYFYKNINIPDIEKIINEIPETEYEPQVVKRDIEADEKRLFDNKVSDVINYLSSYKDYQLHECWSGYETNYFVFTKKDFETDDEVIFRMARYVWDNCRIISERRKEEFSLKKQKKELEDKIAKLNKQIKSFN